MKAEIFLKTAALTFTVVTVLAGAAFGYGSLTNEVASNRELNETKFIAIKELIK